MRRVETWSKFETLKYVQEYMGLNDELRETVTKFHSNNPSGLMKLNLGSVVRLIPFGYLVCNEVTQEELKDFPTEQDFKEWVTFQKQEKIKKEKEQTIAEQNNVSQTQNFQPKSKPICYDKEFQETLV